jgi:uncharacterized damage-inducible protein DinB
MSQIAEDFIKRSRYHLAEDFTPKIERCLELLNDEQVWWRANEKSNSIGNLILHLCGNARQWIVCGIGGAPDARNRDAEFARRELIPRHELVSLLRNTMGEVDQALAGFDPESLSETRTIQGLEVTAIEGILHVVEHFSMHTGQIILITKMLTESDLSFYEFIDAKPILKWKHQPA